MSSQEKKVSKKPENSKAINGQTSPKKPAVDTKADPKVKDTKAKEAERLKEERNKKKKAKSETESEDDSEKDSDE